jgi:hypothetical protein
MSAKPSIDVSPSIEPYQANVVEREKFAGAVSQWPEAETAPAFLRDRISDGKPVSTFPENALAAERALARLPTADAQDRMSWSGHLAAGLIAQ